MTFQQTIRKGFTTLLKHTLNRLTRWLAKTGHSPFSIVRHVGRKSGKIYETPIVIGRLDGAFVLELTYGTKVDWYQNVLAAGGCTLIWHGKDYEVNHIEVLDAEIGIRAFPRLAQVMLRLTRRKHFVRMTYKG